MCLKLSDHVQIFAVPSAFTVPTGMEHWEPLLRARAIENQCYVVAAAQVGKHSNKRETYGHALVVDAWGTVTVDCGRRSPVFGLAEMDTEYLRKLRENMPVMSHAREDLYARDVRVIQMGFSSRQEDHRKVNSIETSPAVGYCSGVTQDEAGSSWLKNSKRQRPQSCRAEDKPSKRSREGNATNEDNPKTGHSHGNDPR